MTNEPPCVQVAALTHPGKLRSHNEDCVVVDGWLSQGSMEQPETFWHVLEEPLLCLVADGMGGHAAGEIASRYAARRLSKETPQLATSEAALADGLCRIHRDLYAEMQRSPEYVGMGTTVAGLILSQEEVLVFNVGDSRVYWCREGGYLTQLSIDDVPKNLPAHARSAQGHKPRISHAITQSLGGFTDLVGITPHISAQRLEVGRYYLLCSDGVTDMLDINALEACVSNDPITTVANLFESAIRSGGKDNITVIAAQIKQGL